MSVLVRVYAISPNNLNITFRRIVVLHSHGSPSIVAETPPIYRATPWILAVLFCLFGTRRN